MHPDSALPFWTPADLANHLWQSSIIALALLLLMALCARLPARTRLALGWMALAKFALPFGIFASVVSLLGGNPDHWPLARLFPAPFSLHASAAAPAGVSADGSTGWPASAPGSGTDSPAAVPAGGRLLAVNPVAGFPVMMVLGTVWLLGFTALQAWWIIGGLRLRRRLLAEASDVSPRMMRQIEAAARKAGVLHLPRCLAGGQGSGPGLLGVWNPILTLPAKLEENLTAAELESVLLHELIHLRRRDPLWLAVHVTAVSALWFNPLAWLLSRWIRLETEKACDERVLELTGQPETYAQGILKVVHLALGLPEPRLLNVITPPVVSRVKNILQPGSHRAGRWPRIAVLALGAVVLALGGNTGQQAVAAITPSAGPAFLSNAPATPGTYTAIFLEPLPEPDAAVPANHPDPGLPVAQAGVSSVTAPEGPAGSGSSAVPVDAILAEIHAPARNLADGLPLDGLAPGTLPGPAARFPEATLSQAFVATPESVNHTPAEEVSPVLPIHLESTAESVAKTAAPESAVPETEDPLPSNRAAVPSALAAAAIPEAIAVPAEVTSFLPATPAAQPAPVFASLVVPAAPVAEPAGTRSKSPQVYSLQEVGTPPVATRQIAPIYPAVLKRSSVEGSATVSFVVKANGDVQDVRAVHSTDPLFAQAAVNAIRGWKFTPAMKDGVSVATTTELPVNFRLTEGGAPASTAVFRPVARFASLAPAAPAKATPAQSQENRTRTYALKELDMIPTPMLQSAPVYPADLKRIGIEGSVDVEFVVAEDGVVEDVRAVRSTDRRFEAAAIAAVSKWKFRPGRLAGKTVPATLSIALKFHLNGNR